MQSFTPNLVHRQLVNNVLHLGSELEGEAPDVPPLELVDAYSRAVLALCAYCDSDLILKSDKDNIRKVLKRETTATA